MEVLTHWGRVTHICVSKLTIIGSDNGLSPGRRQAIIWTNAGIFLIGPLGTNFSEILIETHTFSFTKMHLKLSSGKRRPFCLGLNVLTHPYPYSCSLAKPLMKLGHPSIHIHFQIWMLSVSHLMGLAWTSTYIYTYKVDVINYPYPKIHAALAHLC